MVDRGSLLLRGWVVLLLATAVALSAGGRASAQEPHDAREILQAVVDNLRGGTMEGTYTFTVERPGRASRYVMAILSDGEERGLIRVVEPARDAGQAFLIDGDDLWVYNPRLGRSLRLPPSGRNNAFLGSDVSYNDLAGRDLEEDYTAALLPSEPGSLTLELTPRVGAPTPYGRVMVEVAADHLTPRRIEYYDQRGNVVKRMTLSDYTPAGGRHVPFRMVVEDVTRSGYRTEAVLSEAAFDIALPDGCFTLQALERGCN